MYAARRSGIKQETFGYMEGGYATILDRFHEHLNHLGVETHLDSAVTNISQNDRCVAVESADGTSRKFDEVILTVPCPQIVGICPQLSSSEKERLRHILYQGLICASLLLRKPLGGYYYTNVIDRQIPFTGLIEMTALVDREYFGGNSLAYLPRYTTPDDPFWQRSDAEIQNAFMDGLQIMYPAIKQTDVLAFKVWRIKEIMPILTLNYSRDLLPSTRTSLEHVFVVNSSQIVDGTWNVNEVVRLAKRKSAELVELLSRTEPCNKLNQSN
jgi:protoporphyrinogen oxidase